MKLIGSQLLSRGDNVLEQSLNHRLAQQNIIAANISNAQTPGYRALGYEFEKQLQTAMGNSDDISLRVSDSKHAIRPGVGGDGEVKPDLFVKPSESIGNDGNSVDVDQEMADMAKTQILYKATVELLNRKFAMLRYGVNGGR